MQKNHTLHLIQSVVLQKNHISSLSQSPNDVHFLGQYSQSEHKMTLILVYVLPTMADLSLKLSNVSRTSDKMRVVSGMYLLRDFQPVCNEAHLTRGASRPAHPANGLPRKIQLNHQIVSVFYVKTEMRVIRMIRPGITIYLCCKRSVAEDGAKRDNELHCCRKKSTTSIGIKSVDFQ